MSDADARKAAIIQARNEIAKEERDKAVKLLKDKYREQRAAEVALENINREIEDLEKAIEQGNI